MYFNILKINYKQQSEFFCWFGIFPDGFSSFFGSTILETKTILFCASNTSL